MTELVLPEKDTLCLEQHIGNRSDWRRERDRDNKDFCCSMMMLGIFLFTFILQELAKCHQ